MTTAARPGEGVCADGAVVFRNTADTPIRINTVEPVLGSGGDGLHVVGIKVVPLGDTATEPVVIQRRFPPNKAVGKRWQNVAGATIEPEQLIPAYQLVIGFDVESGTHHVSGIRLEFEAEDVIFHTTFDHGLTLCLTAIPSRTGC